MNPGNGNRLFQDHPPDLAAEKPAMLEKGSAICRSQREEFQLPVESCLRERISVVYHLLFHF